MNIRMACVTALFMVVSSGPSCAPVETEESHYVTTNANGELVHCVSTESGRTYCGTAHTRYSIYGSPDPRCVEGQTWGLDDRGVWVSSGCVADFSPASGDYVASNGNIVHCVSTASGRTYCGTARTRYTIYGNPDPRCVEGQTWGLDDRGVWVSNGCVADFSPGSDDNVVASNGELVHCVATESGRTYCGTARTRYTIAANADPRCVEGQTWGLDDRGVWVSSGCVADFSPVAGDYMTGNGNIVHCVSTDSGRTYCGNAGTRYAIYGNPDPSCVEGRTWGFDDRGVWVSSGCVADFSPSSDDNVVTSNGELVHCVATESGRTYCGTARTRYTIAANADPRCVEGQTWGLDDRGVWVSSGCVADFSPVYSNVGGKLIRCDATGNGRTYCQEVGNRRYTLHEIREGNCVEGQSWGIDSNGLWVSGDCHGDFDEEADND